jgi:hypothetical protein
VKLLARVLLVAAFLFAQAGGVMHEIWHSTAEQTLEGKAPQKNPLCDFHTALGSVLGALNNARAASETEIQKSPSFAAADFRAARFSLLASRSRGPPALL